MPTSRTAYSFDPMLGHSQEQVRKLVDLPTFADVLSHLCQLPMTRRAFRRPMHDHLIWLLHLSQRMALVPRLAPRRSARLLMRSGLVLPSITRWLFVAVVAIFAQSPFQFLNPQQRAQKPPP